MRHPSFVGATLRRLRASSSSFVVDALATTRRVTKASMARRRARGARASAGRARARARTRIVDDDARADARMNEVGWVDGARHKRKRSPGARARDAIKMTLYS